MFKIAKNFHVIHMTDDLQTLDAWYDDVFSVFRFMPPGYMEAEVRDASLVLVGDLCIEPLAPSFRVEGWDRMPLGRFFSRRGKRWHSLAWYVDSREGMGELYDRLKTAGVRLYGTGGVPQTDGASLGALFTHPHDTGTQLEFVVGPSRSRERVSAAEYVSPRGLVDPRFQPGFDPRWWSDHHPLGLLGVSHVTIAVGEAAKLRDLYIEVLDGTLLHEGVMDLTGTQSSFIAVGDDLVVELATPTGPASVIAADMQQHHDNLFAVTFKVRDLGVAEDFLASKGVRAAHNDGTTLLTDPETTHGVVMGFTTWSIPHDERPEWSEAPPAR